VAPLEAEGGARPNLLDQFSPNLENKGKQQVQGYDVIGDIHGHADALCRLLEKLGYRKSGGVYRHPARKVVYLGDFIDRGPRQVEVIKIARSMCEVGAALAVMGNHEFNALAWATRRGDGTYLRPHTEANLDQHEAFLSQIGEDSTAYHEALDWFRSLPLWLELPGLRIIHACWHEESQRILEEQAAVDSKQRLTDVGLQMTSERGSKEFKAAEVPSQGA
jgi:Calcineurin-like phosphoesterase